MGWADRLAAHMAAETMHAHVPATRPTRSSYWFDIVFGRTAPAIFFSVFLLVKAFQLHDALVAVPAAAQPTDYLAPLSQGLGLAYYMLIVVLYVVRLPRRAGDRSPAMIAISFFGSFSVLFIALLPGADRRPYLELLSSLLVAAGLVYTLWSLAYLRRSFSIMPEARRLVTGGPYSLSRHPLYLGEATAAIGIVLPIVSWAGGGLIVLFLASQYIRIRAEERVLSREFPEYGVYAGRVPRYLPDPRRLLAYR